MSLVYSKSIQSLLLPPVTKKVKQFSINPCVMLCTLLMSSAVVNMKSILHITFVCLIRF